MPRLRQVHPRRQRMPTPNWREESVAVAGIDVHFSLLPLGGGKTYWDRL